ncbi:DnaB-like helicase C-terminal domain-containing protein [Methylophaga sp.]|uniref:DnaB-like helicase C-terminal domain-containing protein n=1 Tax=Methylophaga sp. TaxID=2024840 RepID=UPI002722D5E7|nr:DnaB-like helicase C-terminal domain-containing protein [Methylophaga sp.]MDO8828041.1 DnaB-like helicase C-terminal domain-containing protein [Methylophaga sp.]
MDEYAVSVFCSYSHKDEELKNKLLNHLATLKRQKLIDEWNDRAIVPGKDWQREIDDKIRTADLVLLLVSSDFIGSNYCYEKELSIALERHDSNLSVVLPIILRPCDWHETTFAKIQGLPTDGLPITKWNNEDEACLNVIEGIKKTIAEIKKFKKRVGEGAGLLSIRDVLSREIDRIDTVFEKVDSEKCSGLSTGISDLDYVIDGLHPAELIVLASRPAMGKTALSLNFAANIAIHEKEAVAYFSMNTPVEHTTRRLMSLVGSIDSNDLLRGNLKDDDWPRLTSVIALLNEAPLFIDESILSSVDELRLKLINFKQKHNLKAVIIDSLQDLAYREKSLNTDLSYSEYAHKLKHLAMEVQLPIILTVSLPRSVENRPNKRPHLNDLSEFENLTNCADIIGFIYRGEVYEDYDFMDNANAEIIIAKNNNGHIGTIRLLYQTRYSRFSDLIKSETSDVEGMKIDLNNPEEFNKNNLARLLASKDDSQHRQLRVTKSGELYLSDEVGNLNTNDLAFRIETLCAGNGYVGEIAAKDDEWIERVYTLISENWPNPKNSHIEM